MRQLITRIDDDLHARLKDLAQRQGRSVNALVVDALEHLTDDSVDARAALRRRAGEAGLLVTPPRPTRPAPRDEVIARTVGAGSGASEALAAERDAR